MPTRKVLLVKANNEISEIEFDTPIPYDFLKTSVGGWIEIVELSEKVTLCCNEDGKINGLPYNNLATSVWRFYLGDTDVISGDVLFLGEPDEDGESLGLTDDQISSLKTLMAATTEPTADELARYQKFLGQFK